MVDYRHLLNPRSATVRHDAGFLRRTGALITDLLLLDLVVTAPFTPLLLNIVPRAQASGLLNFSYTGAEAAALFIMFGIIYTYFVLFEYLLGQTPGMMVFSTAAKGEGGIWRFLVRNLIFIPVFPIIILWVVEPFMILLKRKSWLEELTRTRTIHERRVMF